ncbi:hypothetical protein LGM48_17060 [Burkholderia multivorans]|uniref:hypothetical protein n=1 Tax=Burkholderia multivorans TaxID=87883 RepID=UPI0020B2D0C7|nr:hypothetical protein [Burkholderia multivorans]MCA8176026.1 hypothetical protein [Burkholderia multivorans]
MQSSAGARADEAPSAILDTVRATFDACEDLRLETIMSTLVPLPARLRARA